MSVNPARADGLTKNQSLVFKTLNEAAGPLTAYTILDHLRADGFKAPLQVYRALDKLQEAGLVHRLESLNAFVACCQPECGAHENAAFAICEDCGKVQEFASDEAAGLFKAWAREQNFRLLKTTIELRGQCALCQDS